MNIELTASINPSDIEEQILQIVAQQIVAKVELRISHDVRILVADKIDAQLTQIVIDAFNKKYQPVDEFGDNVGNMTTFKEMLSKKAVAFLDEKVDRDGKVIGSYGSGTKRSEFVINRMVADTMNTETTRQVKELATQAKSQIEQKVAALIVATVSKG